MTIDEVYNVIARHYNAKPKNIVRYNSVNGIEHTVNPGVVGDVFDQNPGIVGNFTSTTYTHINSTSSPLYFGSCQINFFPLQAIIPNVEFSIFPWQVTSIDQIAQNYGYNPEWVFYYDSAGIKGINFPNLNKSTVYQFNSYNTAVLEAMLFNGFRVITRTDATGFFRVRISFSFDGFLVNFK